MDYWPRVAYMSYSGIDAEMLRCKFDEWKQKGHHKKSLQPLCGPRSWATATYTAPGRLVRIEKNK